MTTSSAASASSPKVSKFGAKSGFVIPKNKLSGSLVPVFRGGGKKESRDAVKEESSKQVQRKTKWGADLTQDADVRKGRALAYQTRVEQITQQLKSGVLKIEDGQDSESITEVPNPESSKHQNDDQVEKFERLELEKREAIGEILKLNPSYKVPPDYKPLLKEAKVPIPLTRYPGYSFIGLILGSGSNTQKRLEEETGAKIRIHGTKAGTQEKGEITLSDGNEVQSAYEELSVHVSAETIEKVDAAVSLIELLVTPLSGNPAVVSSTSATISGDSVNVLDLSQKDAITATSYMMPIPVINQGLMQPMMGPTQPGHLQVPFQPYRGPWFPPGPPQTALHSHSGFPPPPNSSLPMPNNAIQFPPPPINPSNMRPFFGGQPSPNTSAGFSTIARNPSFYAPGPQPVLQGMQRPYMPEARPPCQIFPPNNHPMPSLQNPLTYSMPPRPNPAMAHQITGNQPFTPVGSSNAWSGAPITAPASQGPSNMMQMARPMGLSNVPTAVMSTSATGNMMSTFPSQSSTLRPGAPINPPATGLSFTSRPPLPSSASAPLQAPSSMAEPRPAPFSVFPQATPSALAQATSPHVAQGPGPNLSVNPVLGSAPVPLASSQPQSGTPGSVSVSIPSFTPMRPPMTSPGSVTPVTAPRPHRPNSGDFTFQPVRPQLPASQTSPGPSNQSVSQNAPLMPPKPTVQPPPAPQAPSFRPAIHNFPSPQATNQAVQPQALVRGPSFGFAGNSPSIQHPPRAMSFGNPNPVLPMSPVPQMGLQGFILPRQMSNSPRSLPPRPVNPLQLQQNQLAPTARPGNLAFSSSRQAWSPRGNQVYDPFSPTSASPAPSQQAVNPAKSKKQEDDPEYDDLMASVGVR